MTAPPAEAQAPAAGVSKVTAPAMVNIVDAAPRVSDPEFAHIAKAMAGRDPEASLDIPPPAEITPREERPADATDPYIGTTFDHRYKIQKLLGEGGMGFVYLARHKVIDKKVAVKVLRADLAKDREILDRFLQEAKAASSIGNPHIVDISDFGDLPDGSTYFVMEFLEGKALSQVVDAGERMSVERICDIGMQICDGLAAAHARGIVHRDLKPDNVYLLDRSDHDFVKILDFGIAKVSGNANSKLTKAGQVFGTPHYMSPEQAAGSTVDHRTDIYALGVMLYEMVSGQLPFNADNFMGILTQHMYKAPVPIRALVPSPDCPPGLEAIVLKCLSKKQDGRYQSMEELGADLERVKATGTSLAVAEMMGRSGGFNVPADYFKQPAAIVPATPPTPQKRWSRYVLVAGIAASVTLVGAVLVVGRTGSSAPLKGSATTVAAAPSAVPSVTATATATATAAAAPKKIVRVLVTAPLGAKVTRDGNAVESAPCTTGVLKQVCFHVDIEEGGSAQIVASGDAYVSETRTIDSQNTIVPIFLKPAHKGGGKGGPTQKGGGGKGEIVNPKGWN